MDFKHIEIPYGRIWMVAVNDQIHLLTRTKGVKHWIWNQSSNEIELVSHLELIDRDKHESDFDVSMTLTYVPSKGIIILYT